MSIHTLKLVRSGQTFTDSTGAQGEWCDLWVDATPFDAIERSGGYVRLKKGETYKLKCYKSAKLGKVLSPIHTIKNREGAIAKIRIHSASYPHHLAGCIAPGFKNSSGTGLKLSQGSLDYILELLGGWEEGEEVGTISIA